MEKELIPRDRLASQVLDLLHREPGCAGVKEVSITQVHVINEGTTTWRTSVVDYGDAIQSVADHAAEGVRDILFAKYDLAD
jgi:hypothetical protein